MQAVDISEKSETTGIHGVTYQRMTAFTVTAENLNLDFMVTTRNCVLAI